MLHVLRVRRHEHLHVVLGLAVAALAVDQNLVHVAAVEVADHALDQAAFLVDRRGRDRLQRQVADHLPLAQQVFVVAPDLGLGAGRTGGADDEAGAVRNGDRGGDFLELLAVGGVGDLAADAAAARRVGHQHAVASGEREIGGECRALVAPLFLDDLDEQDLADLDHFLDLVAAGARHAPRSALLGDIVAAYGFVVAVRRVVVRFMRPVIVIVIVIGMVGLAGQGLLGRARLVGNVDLDVARRGGRRRHVLEPFGLGAFRHRGCEHGVVAGGGAFGGRLRPPAAARAAAAGLGPLGFLVGLAGECGLLGHQRLAVGLGDLVVVGMDFREREEPVAVAAVVDERRLQRRLDAGHLGEIDVAGELPLVQRFKVELFDPGSVHHDDAGLFRVRGIDQHFLGHGFFRERQRHPVPCGTGCPGFQGVMRKRVHQPISPDPGPGRIAYAGRVLRASPRFCSGPGTTRAPNPCLSGPKARDSLAARTPVASLPGSSKTTEAVLQCR